MKKINLVTVLFLLTLASCGYSKAGDADVNANKNVADSVGFSIPFQLIDDRVVVVVRLNGLVDVKLAVDNGVNQLHLTESFAKRYADTFGMILYPDIPAMEKFLVPSNAGCYLAKGDFSYHFEDSIFVNYNKSTHVVDGNILKDFAYILEENDGASKWVPDGVVGIMPLECFSKNGIIKINFEKNRFEFPELIDSLAIPYKYDDIQSHSVKFPIILFNESNQNSYLLSTIFDLGYNGSVLILKNKESIQMIEDMNNCANNNVSIISNIGSSIIPYFPKNIMIGKDSILVKNIDLLYRSNIPYKTSLLIGTRLMSKYNMFFDYKNSTVYTFPLSKEINLVDNEFSILYGMRFRVEPKGVGVSYAVSAIIHDYKKVDAKLGDVILKINDVSIENICEDSVEKIRNNKDIPQNSITVKRGKDTIVLHRTRD